MTKERANAPAQHPPPEQVARDLLRAALIAAPVEPTPEEVVARVWTAPPNPAGLQALSGSLADALGEADGADFDGAATPSG